MKRVVFDTNVWVSAFAFRGRVRLLLEAALRGEMDVAVSPAILDETALVLMGRKFKYSVEAVAAVEREIRDLALVVRPVGRLAVIKDDPDDDRVLECAVASGAEIIISGDGHLLSLGSFRGIRIISPAAFLDELEQEWETGKSPESGTGVHEPRAIYRPPEAPARGEHSRIRRST